MDIRHIILCIEFVFLAVQIVTSVAAKKSPLRHKKSVKRHKSLSVYHYMDMFHSNHSFKYHRVRWFECSK